MPLGPSSDTKGKLVDYTGLINKIPDQYGRIRRSGLFRARPTASTRIIIDKYEYGLSILPSKPRGSDPTVAKKATRAELSLPIPHIPHIDRLAPEDIQDMRMLGGLNPESLAHKRSLIMTRQRETFEMTMEYMMLGALKGIVYDGDGNQVIDLYTQFGETQVQTNWALSNGATDVNGLMRTASRTIETGLKAGGAVYDHIHVLCNPSFFDKLVSHGKIEDYYKRYTTNTAAEPLRNDLRQGFPHQGLIFEEYNGTVTLADGTTTEPLIPVDKAYAFPVGLRDMFQIYYAPANRFSWVNRPGVPFYFFEIRDPLRDQWIEFDGESNPLPICTRPQGVIELTAT